MTPEQRTRLLLQAAGFPMHKLQQGALDYFLYVEMRTPEQIVNIYTRTIPEKGKES